MSSKEFTPAMVKTIHEELAQSKPKNHFTIGINDDVTHTSLDYDRSFEIESDDVTRALFFGMGSDGTVGANKNSIKITGENTDLYCQGYFVYDSKKSGSRTVSHLRFGPQKIHAPYLIQSANFIACHKFNLVEQIEILQSAAKGAVLLLNSTYPADEVWDKLPQPVQQSILDLQIRLHVIDASHVAWEAGMGKRINTVMQVCFFALSGLLPRDEANRQIKQAIEKTYRSKGQAVVEQNLAAVDSALDHLYEVEIPATTSSTRPLDQLIPSEAPRFVREVTAQMMRGHGVDLPVSMLPVDGTCPGGTTRWEKSSASDRVPAWEPELCIQCGNCSFVCPHIVIRAKFYHDSAIADAPDGFPSTTVSARGFPETRYTLQIYVEDWTGCNLCVDACPVKSPDDPAFRAINMTDKAPLLEQEKKNIEFFASLEDMLGNENNEKAAALLSIVDHLVRRSVWLIGGDGWAYDIGSGGLDHVLASGRNVNVLVLDTEVYSNTGGQMSKATPLGASAKFASAGKRIGKKDLVLQAVSYGSVYVAQVAMGANPQQTLLAMHEAEEYQGPSFILACSHCIAHGYDMADGMKQQKLATASGYWSLIRYNPTLRAAGKKPFVLDSPRPSISLKEYAYNEMRYKILQRTNPGEADKLMQSAQELVVRRWQTYEQMQSQGASKFQA